MTRADHLLTPHLLTPPMHTHVDIQLIRSLMTRAMSEAKYLSTGSAPPGSPATYHYGLALKYYTHFTSPIRRCEGKGRPISCCSSA